MYVVREIMHCKPGKVREMVNKFKGLSSVMQGMGLSPFRIMTDVSGEPYWTVIAEMDVDGLDGFAAMEAKVMANPDAQKAMTGYHDLIQNGRREIYKLES